MENGLGFFFPLRDIALDFLDESCSSITLCRNNDRLKSLLLLLRLTSSARKKEYYLYFI